MASTSNHCLRAGCTRARAELSLWTWRVWGSLALLPLHTVLAAVPAAAHFRQTAQPILAQYCYDCHGDGMKKGGLALDALEADPASPQNRDLWWKVMKYVRSGIMP